MDQRCIMILEDQGSFPARLLKSVFRIKTHISVEIVRQDSGSKIENIHEQLWLPRGIYLFHFYLNDCLSLSLPLHVTEIGPDPLYILLRRRPIGLTLDYHLFDNDADFVSFARRLKLRFISPPSLD